MDRFKKLDTPVKVDFVPRDVTFCRYMLPNTLDKSEAEEMAARMLELWKENDSWMAVNYDAICDQLEKDLNDIENGLEVPYTFLVIDRFRIAGPSAVEIGISYLINNGYIHIQRYEEDKSVFMAPTDKLLEAVKRFTKK